MPNSLEAVYYQGETSIEPVASPPYLISQKTGGDISKVSLRYTLRVFPCHPCGIAGLDTEF